MIFFLNLTYYCIYHLAILLIKCIEIRRGTATRDQQILFNSVTILHLCEKGSKIGKSENDQAL